MGGASGMESVRATGSDMELLHLREAQLYLVDDVESILMQWGEFRLVLTKQLRSPLAAVVALVKDVEWPVGKDSPVLKVGKGCYTFCLPGMTYGLVLPDSTSNESRKQMDLVLAKYSTYEDRSEIGEGSSAMQAVLNSDQAAAVKYWNDVAPEVETMSSRLAWHEHGRGSEQAAQLQKKTRNTNVAGGSSGPGQVSPRMMKRVQQARRLSAVAKLFSRALLKGAISNGKHVTNSSRAVKDISGRRHRRDEAVASVDAFAKVVEAVESTGKSLPDLSLDPSAFYRNEKIESKQAQQSIETAWTLNKLGLHLLIGAVAASTAINFSKSNPSTSVFSPFSKLPQRPQVPASIPVHYQPAYPPGSSSSFTGYGFRPVIPQSHHQANLAQNFHPETFFLPQSSSVD